MVTPATETTRASSLARSASGGSLLTFFFFTYVVMWASFFSLAAGVVPLHSPLRQPVLLIGVFAPSVVALLLTAHSEGAAGVRALLHRLVRWQVPARWYLLAIAYIPTVKLAVALVHRLAIGSWPRFGDEPWYVIAGAIAVSTPFQAERRLAGVAMRFLGWPSASGSPSRASF